MSRFLNLKTASVDEQLVANIIATLNIPLHEVIDGVSEDSTDTFKRLVFFYKEQLANKEGSAAMESPSQGPPHGEERRKTTATINISWVEACQVFCFLWPAKSGKRPCT